LAGEPEGSRVTRKATPLKAPCGAAAFVAFSASLMNCGALRHLVFLFQALAVVASFQLTTVGHFVSDVVQVVTVGNYHHDNADGDEDQPGHECPPGCPNCHHVHLSGASIQPSSVTAVATSPAAVLVAGRFLLTQAAPAGPHLPAVYRPPRA
jgi:hypothetical protein